MKLFKLLSYLTAGLALVLSAPTFAGGLGPDIPAPVKGEECVADTQEMRVNHMKHLKGHRDDVLRSGIRTKQYHLSECIECHVPARDQAQPAKASGEHFCMSCHSFVGVKVDCFSCHATMPEKSAAFHPIVTPAMQAMKQVHQAPSAHLLQELASRGASDE